MHEEKSPDWPTMIMFGLFGLVFVVMLIVAGNSRPPKSASAPEPGPAKPPTADQLKEACRYAKLLYGRKPITEIPVDALDAMSACKQLGLW